MDAVKKIIVTGGSGYLGAIVVQELLARGYDVVSIDCAKPKVLPGTCGHRLKIVQDGFNTLAAKKSPLSGAFAVIHLAGVSDGRKGRSNPAKTWEINSRSSRKLIVSARDNGVERFVFASTFGVYGDAYRVPLTEELAINPREPYSASKADIEHFLMETSSDRFVTTSLRLAMVYGWSPGMRYDLLVNALIRNAITAKKLEISGGDQVRPQIHIRDAAVYFCEVLQLPSERCNHGVFNVGAHNDSVGEIANCIKQSMKCDIDVVYRPERPDEKSFVLDSTKIKNEIRYQPKGRIDSAIHEIWKHVECPIHR